MVLTTPTLLLPLLHHSTLAVVITVIAASVCVPSALNHRGFIVQHPTRQGPQVHCFHCRHPPQDVPWFHTPQTETET